MQNPDVNFWLRKRYLVLLLTFTGFMIMLILRTNLSIAIVEMTSDKSIISGNSTLTKKAEFDWDSRMKGFILSAFSIGLSFSLLGGMMAVKYGGVTIYGLGIGLTALLTVLTPFFMRIHLSIFILVRTLEGVLQGSSMASVPAIYLHWAPPNERSRLLLCTTAGAYFGGAVNYSFSGFLAYYYGWQAVFYVSGALGLVWYAIWFLCTSNDPTTDRFMTQRERDYFKNFVTTPVKRKTVSYPWRKMFTSKPVWAYLNENFTFYWYHSFLMYCIPLYVKDVYNVSIDNIGLISAIPILAGAIGIIISACLADYIRTQGCLEISSIHRIFITTGQVSCLIGTFIAGVWANFEQSIICFAIARFMFGLAETSYFVLVIDAFHECSGVVRGLALTVMSIPSFLNPIIMGYMVADHTRTSWNLYFIFLNVFNIWSLIIWYLYGSAKRQPWATLEAEEKTDEIR